jgi:hypothetical protein
MKVRGTEAPFLGCHCYGQTAFIHFLTAELATGFDVAQASHKRFILIGGGRLRHVARQPGTKQLVERRVPDPGSPASLLNPRLICRKGDILDYGSSVHEPRVNIKAEG